eukprot:2807543-Pleurochrysis_carterae.AAC.2
MLLTFDALFDFRKVMRQRFDMDEREERALLFAQKCVLPLASAFSALAYRTFWEQFERVSVGRYKSQYPHAVQYKSVQQMLQVGDLWNCSLSVLESYHVEVGRIADRTGCKRLSADVDAEITLKPEPLKSKGRQGRLPVVEMKVSTTVCSRIANRLVAARALNKDTELDARTIAHHACSGERRWSLDSSPQRPQARGGCGAGHHLHHRICPAACMNLPFLFLAVAADVCSNYIFLLSNLQSLGKALVLVTF